MGDANPLCQTSSTVATNPFPSNFSCNPSGIDGVAITQSSQGGGGIFVHGWAHNIQIANNRLYNNAGTLAGGINVGQGEFAPLVRPGQRHQRGLRIVRGQPDRGCHAAVLRRREREHP